MDKKILEILEAVWAPKWVTIMYFWGYKKGETTAAEGNWMTDKEAKQAAPTGGQTSASLTAALFLYPLFE
jgi:hypothetical protein